jgi:hypothetical protein
MARNYGYFKSQLRCNQRRIKCAYVKKIEVFMRLGAIKDFVIYRMANVIWHYAPLNLG